MKILYILKTSDGAEWAYKLAKKIQEYGHFIKVVLPNQNGVMSKRYLNEGFDVSFLDLSLPSKRIYTIFSRIKEYRRLVAEYKPDIIHMHFFTNVILARIALRKVKTPRIFQIPGPLHLESILFKNIELFFAQKQDYWIATCKKTFDIYQKCRKSQAKVFLSYYGGYGGKDVLKYNQNANILHKQYSIEPNKKIISMISYFYKPKYYLFQFTGIKGHEIFINAISILEKKRTDFVAVIIGGPWVNSKNYFEKIQRLSMKKCSTRFIFTGHRNDLKDIYSEISIAVHPSLSENLGGAAESLAAAVPTICSNVGGFIDIVIPNHTGFLFQSRNPVDLAAKLENVLDNYHKAKQFSENGRNLVRKILDIEVTSKEVISIYDIINEG